MGTIEKRARELLAAEFGRRILMPGRRTGMTFMQDAAIRAIIAALTPPEGYVLVPFIPSYEMTKAFADTAGCNLACAALAYRDALAARPEVP